jgi:hypothetical protein
VLQNRYRILSLLNGQPQNINIDTLTPQNISIDTLTWQRAEAVELPRPTRLTRC